MSPVWIARNGVLAIHEEQVAEHGGAVGLRDPSALDVALDRPRNSHAYGETDVVRLAAPYAFGLVRNHAFIDGNKRVSAVVTELFLALSGLSLDATDAELVEAWTALAGGAMDEERFAEWLLRHCGPAGQGAALP